MAQANWHIFKDKSSGVFTAAFSRRQVSFFTQRPERYSLEAVMPDHMAATAWLKDRTGKEPKRVAVR